MPQPNGSYVIDAGISVRALNERLQAGIPENGSYVTLGGFMMMKTGRVPREGDVVEFEGSAYQVEQMVERRIMRVRMTRSMPIEVEDGQNIQIDRDAS